ncbi:EFR1 family ferrodoxin [Clostridium sp. AL.422]|uniref:EFR1 family ferrodoxin n=1 Tax=Clostridium TaxID=1485 RepID=UPI00293DE20B|nr:MULTISPECIES: EFR1 family ferrodoxin [unclassified Clostridium]MDV4149385.1 EFR1 family ferrodoxin [Clostridium sp. AL.422]
MKITHITVIFYSATGNTRKVITRIAKNIQEILRVPISYINYTRPQNRQTSYSFGSEELVLFASPTYAGRIPNKMLPYIDSSFLGTNTPVIPIVVYGNRSFDNSLSELTDILSSNGFIPFSAAAIATVHAFSSKIGTNRPDEKDLQQIDSFCKNASEYLLNSKNLLPIEVPGEHPAVTYYKPLGIDNKPVNFLKAKPKTIKELCDNCGACAKACPMSAINFIDNTLVPGTCIKCQCCVKICHTNAKYFDNESFLSHIRMLEEHYARRSEPSFFLPLK